MAANGMYEAWSFCILYERNSWILFGYSTHMVTFCLSSTYFSAMLCVFSASFRLFSINENSAFFSVTHFHDNIRHISFNYIFFSFRVEIQSMHMYIESLYHPINVFLFFFFVNHVLSCTINKYIHASSAIVACLVLRYQVQSSMCQCHSPNTSPLPCLYMCATSAITRWSKSFKLAFCTSSFALFKLRWLWKV